MQGAVATIIFAVSLGLMLADVVHRTIVAMFGAVLMVVAGLALGFYDEAEAVGTIDFTTLGLLLGMMIVVALLEPTGFFEYVALRAGRLSRGRPVYLFVLLGAVTAVLAMLLDNVTTVVVIAPVTLVIARVLRVDVVPLLVAEAMLSNVGGLGTLIGDPPNILIGSAAGLSFNDFLVHMLPVAVVVWVAATGYLLFAYREHLGRRPTDLEAVMRLHPREALKQPRVARRLLVVLGVAVVFFLLQDTLEISPALIALGAAGAALVVVRPDVHEAFMRVEWTVLVFFAGLFVMVGGLDAAGVLQWVAERLGGAGGLDPMLLGIAIIWAAAAFSAVVDNVPMTIAMIPVIAGLETTGVEIQPLWWALAIGAAMGGNATIIGASANVVVVSVSERCGEPIRSVGWMKVGVPLTVLSCVVATVLYVLLFPLMRG